MYLEESAGKLPENKDSIAKLAIELTYKINCIAIW